MNEQALFLDLQRMVDDAQDRALRLEAKGMTDVEEVYRTPVSHRMHTVCETLEALGYVRRMRRWDVAWESAWSLTTEGRELLEELRGHKPRRRRT